MNTIEIQLPEGKVILLKQADGFNVKLESKTDNYIYKFECFTTYPIEIINKIIDIKGFCALCDEIQRDQLHSYIQKPLETVIFSHFVIDDFKGKRILDFGCGAGNSTVIIGRTFKESEVIGVELSSKFLELAEMRKQFYNLDNVSFRPSINGTDLPENIGNFDYIVLNAVYEHLLPIERKIVFHKLWERLKSGGSLIINETPHRWFPVETHTTEGFPLINYLPDRMVYYFVKRFSKKARNLSWSELLRAGIRGGSVKELMRILKIKDTSASILQPSKLGIRDRIELFDKSLADDRLSRFSRKLLFLFLKLLKYTTGVILTPTLSFVIKKG